MRFLFAWLVLTAVLLAFPPHAIAEQSAVTAEELSGPDSKIFADKTFGKLKPGVTPEQIAEIKNPFLRGLATSIKEGQYNTKNRFRTYNLYESIAVLGKKLKTNKYSQFENPTGIYFDGSEPAVLIVDGLGDNEALLKINDWSPDGNRQQNTPLKNGLNIIPVEHKGLGYISYYTDNYTKPNPIKIRIISGQVNGVFNSATNTNKDWKDMLDNAVCEVLDIQGKYVHLVYPVEDLKAANPDKGLELVALYDRLIRIQHQMMGLVKYGLVPKNRMFGRVSWKGGLFADGLGAGFARGSIKNDIGNPETLKKAQWVVSHEFGHVNQTRPGMRWHGTAEVTNNLFSIWAQYQLTPSYINLEDHKKDDTYGNKVTGGRFNAFLNAALVENEIWLFQKGPDRMKDSGYKEGKGADHFVKLCPLWQLQLYCMVANMGNPDFLPDIFQIVRKTDETGLNAGQLQLNFLKNVCDTNKQDFTDFFVKTGMLKPVDLDMSDYGMQRFTITQNDCDKLIEYAKKYRKPATPVIYYLSSKSVNAYKNRLPVQGVYGEGVTPQEHALLVSHSVWKNVTVFEAYKGDELVRISLVGTDSPENKSTLAQYPEGSTRLEAVAWDGKRTLVYGNR